MSRIVDWHVNAPIEVRMQRYAVSFAIWFTAAQYFLAVAGRGELKPISITTVVLLTGFIVLSMELLKHKRGNHE